MSRNVRAGKNRHRITVEEKGTPTRDTHGGEVIAWATLATMWAEVLPFGSRQFLDAQQERTEDLTTFRVRYRTDIDKNMRVIWRSRTFEIVGVPTNMDGRDRRLDIVGREVT